MQNLFNKVAKSYKKEKHTIARLTVFTRAFCHKRVENLLKETDTAKNAFKFGRMLVESYWLYW